LALGLPVRRIRLVVYTMSGMAAGLAGLVAVLGSASLAGGQGRVWMTLVGALIIGTLTNGLVLLDISSFWQMVATGIVLVAAAALDRLKAEAG
jgi:ribose transport system permease protein